MPRAEFIKSLLQQKGAVLAPMAGITDYPMRRLCHEAGALWCVSEMISAKAVIYQNKRTLEIARVHEGEGPVALQLFGSEPEIIYQAIRLLAGTKAVIFDLNMGCPTPKITRNGDGASLMLDPGLVGEIVAAARSATGLPLMVKMRSGWDYEKVNAPLIARVAEKNGADAVCVHPRVRCQMFEGFPDWDVVKRVREKISIPLIASGNIHTYQDVQRITAETKADGVMIGRGALGDPWIFARISCGLLGGALPMPTVGQRLAMAKRHLQLALECGPEHVVITEMRKHIAWYLKGMKGAASFRARTNSCATAAQMSALLSEIETT